MTTTFTVQPSWADKIRESMLDSRSVETLGRSGAKTVQGYAVSLRNRFEFPVLLDRAEAREMLAFWRARRGAFEAFKMDLPWTPGTASADAPHSFDGSDGVGLVRFTGDGIKLKWLSGDLVEATLGFAQVKDSTETDASVYLYHLYTEDPESGIADEYLTEWCAPVTYGGHTCLPARIQHEEISEEAEFQKEVCKLAVDVRDSAIVRGLVQRTLDGLVSVDVIGLDLATGASWDYFSGRIGKIPRKGRVIKPEVQLWGGIANRMLPAILKSRTCPYCIYGPGCRRLNPSRMARSNWATTGTLNNIWEGGKVLLDNVALDAKAVAYFASNSNSGYWAGGIVSTGSGWRRQVRPVTFSAFGSDGILSFIPLKPFRTGTGWMQTGDTVTIYPGCDGTYTHCNGKFGNHDAFGGQSFTPAYIQEAGTKTSSSGK